MVFQCPSCGNKYHIQMGYNDCSNFSMRCANCGTELTSLNVIDSSYNVSYLPRRNSRKVWLWVLGVILLLLTILVLTRPEKSMHTEKVRDLTMQYMEENIATEDNITQGLAFLFGPYLIDRFIDINFRVDDYIIFNIGCAKSEDGYNPITFGILGNVFLLIDSNQIEKALKDAKDESQTPS